MLGTEARLGAVGTQGTPSLVSSIWQRLGPGGGGGEHLGAPPPQPGEPPGRQGCPRPLPRRAPPPVVAALPGQGRLQARGQGAEGLRGPLVHAPGSWKPSYLDFIYITSSCAGMFKI